MSHILSILSLIFGSTLSQFNPVRDPSLTIAATEVPIFTVRPIRTIGPLITTLSNTINTLSTTTNIITSTTTSTNTTQINNSDNQEESINMELVYILVPTLGTILLCCVPYFFCRKKQKKQLQNVNNNVVNIDLNIENIIPRISERQVSKQSSNNSERFSNHIYEEVDYEARYEMPYNNENVYGRQVTTIV